MMIRKPILGDIPKMQAMVRPEVESGIILERSDMEMANTIRSYTIALEGEEIIGFGALHIHTPGLAEIRSLIVAPSHRGKGVGHAIVDSMLQEARALGLLELLVLAYRRELFEQFGFVEIPKSSVPEQKIWADCIRCKHFPICNEISLIKHL